MPRIARIVIEGLPHHITQRGNDRSQVFFSDEDRERYLSWLKEQSDKHHLEVHGYCLMTNHVHIVATPHIPESLALAIGRTNFRYAQRVNRMQGRSGHVWQNRFYSCAMDNWHYWRAMRYIEQNPVRAHIVRSPCEYLWSSAAAHIGILDSSNILDLKEWHKSVADLDWETILQENLSEEMLMNIRMHTKTGRPWMDDSFLDRLETEMGRRLRPLSRGRPKNNRAEPDEE